MLINSIGSSCHMTLMKWFDWLKLHSPVQYFQTARNLEMAKITSFLIRLTFLRKKTAAGSLCIDYFVRL